LRSSFSCGFFSDHLLGVGLLFRVAVCFQKIAEAYDILGTISIFLGDRPGCSHFAVIFSEHPAMHSLQDNLQQTTCVL
jgi:hypothetical protein